MLVLLCRRNAQRLAEVLLVNAAPDAIGQLTVIAPCHEYVPRTDACKFGARHLKAEQGCRPHGQLLDDVEPAEVPCCRLQDVSCWCRICRDSPRPIGELMKGDFRLCSCKTET